MIVIQCPRCLQKYRLPDDQIGTTVHCSRPDCSQAFSAMPVNGSAEPHANDGSQSVGVSESTARRIEAQRVVDQLTARAPATNPPSKSGRVLMWIGMALTILAAVTDASVPSDGGGAIHNLSRAGHQLLLAIIGSGALMAGAALAAKDGSRLTGWDTAAFVGWGLTIAFLLALPLLV